MTERPILFSAPMVKAILEGRKTQTRRVVKPQPLHIGWFEHQQGWCAQIEEWRHEMFRCPFGVVGDRLWVRETWQTYRPDSDEESNRKYEASLTIKTIEDLYAWSELPGGGGEKKVMYAADFGEWAYNPESDLQPWKPPIFMPRWASRITLEITEVRVQRLQQITAADCQAEGVGDNGIGYPCIASAIILIDNFEKLWDSINGKKHPWESNPWVWAISFRRLP